jgi:hypothetical protein
MAAEQVETYCVLCEVLAEAEQKAEHRVHNKTQTNQMSALRLMILTLGFL